MFGLTISSLTKRTKGSKKDNNPLGADLFFLALDPETPKNNKSKTIRMLSNHYFIPLRNMISTSRKRVAIGTTP